MNKIPAIGVLKKKVTAVEKRKSIRTEVESEKIAMRAGKDKERWRKETKREVSTKTGQYRSLQAFLRTRERQME